MKKQQGAGGVLAGTAAAVLATAMVLTAGTAVAGRAVQRLTGAEIFVEDLPDERSGVPTETIIYNGVTYVPLEEAGWEPEGAEERTKLVLMRLPWLGGQVTILCPERP